MYIAKSIRQGREWHLHMIGDVHLGSKNAAKDQYWEACEYVTEDELGSFLFMGDMVNAITPKDRRFDLENLDLDLPTFDDQYNYIEGGFIDAAGEGRVEGWIFSNHYGKVSRETSFNYERKMCKSMEIPYLGNSAFLIMQLQYKRRKQDFILWVAHGTGGGEYVGGKTNRMARLLAKFDADAYFMGHTHMLMVWDKSKIGVDRELAHKIKPTQVMDGKLPIIDYTKPLGLTGSFYKTYALGQDDYAERAQYFPLAIGWLELILTIDGDMECRRHVYTQGKWRVR